MDKSQTDGNIEQRRVCDNQFYKWSISLLNIVITCFPMQPYKNVEIQIIIFQKIVQSTFPSHLGQATKKPARETGVERLFVRFFPARQAAPYLPASVHIPF